MTRANNLDFIRFLAACLVIFSHAFGPLTGQGIDPLITWSQNQISFGGLAVGIFFIISGYLIPASYLRTKNLKKFIIARGLRIFPALLVLIIFTVFVVGSVLTNLSLAEYFREESTYHYFKNILLYPVVFGLPGVIFSDGIYGQSVNGSIWTLSYEFSCYLITAVLGFFGFLNKRSVLVIFAVLLLIYLLWTSDGGLPNGSLIPYLFLHTNYVLLFFLYFFSGALYFFYRDNIEYNNYWILFFIVTAFSASFYFGYGFLLLFILFGPYMLFSFAFTKFLDFSSFSYYGDFSYGIYIYGFLIQQIFIRLFGGTMDPIFNFTLSLFLAILCGFFSWHLIEKHAIRMKKYF